MGDSVLARGAAVLSSGRLIPPATVWELALWLLGRRQCYRIVGDSMLPILRDGDRVLAVLAGHLQRGDIVIARHPYQEKLIIKQLGACHGQRLVLCGNDQSMDSRHFGTLPRSAILCEVTAILR